MAVKTSDLKEWGIVKKLNDMMCDDLFGPEESMTDDLVARLRSPEVFIDTGGMFSPVANEAADRIEQLEAALQTIVTARENRPDNCSDEYLVWCCIDTARAALEGKDD